MVDLRAKPFNLDDQGVAWVESTLASMDADTRLGQLFCLIAMDPGQLQRDQAIAEPCGYMARPMPAAELEPMFRGFQSAAHLPLLLAANLEDGANGLVVEGTSFGNPLQIAASDDVDAAYHMGVATGREARAMGCTWGFAPVCDVQLNWQNPITNTRAFGSDATRVAAMSAAFVRGLQEQGVAASPKHWPGDGVDDRDQHLVMSVNSLSVEDWEANHGHVYRTLIDAGAMTIMAAHIAQPALSKMLRPDIADADILPGSLSYELTTTLLRERMGFDGLVVSDASAMTGMMISMPRSQAVPAAIMAGCDVFLFVTDYATDYGYMKAAYDDGRLTPQRVEEAVTRVLALKAALGLHTTAREDLVPGLQAMEALPRDEHRAWAAASAGKAVTLVKNRDEGVLPLSVSKFPRVLVYPMVKPAIFAPATGPYRFVQRLRDEGFTVTEFEAPKEFSMEKMMGGGDGVTPPALLDDYDLVMYVSEIGPMSNEPVIRVGWAPLTAGNAPKYIHEIPTLFISLASPFHLQDAPQVRTFINAYSGNDATVTAVIERLMGRAPFTGTNPVDPFCDYWDAAR